MKTETSCPVCSAPDTAVFLQRQGVPVHQNLLLADAEAARAISRGDLEMAVCDSCGFVFNQAFDPAKLSYGGDYDNDQSGSPRFLSHMDSLAHLLLMEKGVRDSRIVEVGCGQGQFMRLLVDNPHNNTAMGFDPSYTGPDEALEGRMRFVAQNFDETAVGVEAGVVVCRHVIEHVGDPVGFLRGIRGAVGEGARIYIETPDVDWILENRVVWDFFFEHCSLFSPGSLATALARSGFEMTETRSVFGGQYLFMEAKAVPVTHDIAPVCGPTCALALAFGEHEQNLLQGWKKTVLEYQRNGNVGLWGAGAKGATLANLVDPEASLLSCVVDINSNKCGKYVAGTGHPITDLAGATERGVKALILMNPEYREENELLLKTAGSEICLVRHGKTQVCERVGRIQGRPRIGMP
jgi:SAM-dependent methyltransferase